MFFATVGILLACIHSAPLGVLNYTQLRLHHYEHPNTCSFNLSRTFPVKITMKLIRANDGKHKWIAEFKDGTHTRFGAVGMDDYTITHDKEQRERYRTRHKANENWNDPKSAGALSRFILWGDSTSIHANKRAYETRFSV